MGEALDGDHRDQREQRGAAAEGDRGAVDGGGDQPAAGALAAERLDDAEQRRSAGRSRGRSAGRGSSRTVAPRYLCAGRRSSAARMIGAVRRAGDHESPGRATTGDESARSFRLHALRPPPLQPHRRRCRPDPRPHRRPRRHDRHALGGRGHDRLLPRRARRPSGPGRDLRHAAALRLPAAAPRCTRPHAPRPPRDPEARAHRRPARRRRPGHAARPARDRLLRPRAGAGAAARAVGRDRRRRASGLGRRA